MQLDVPLFVFKILDPLEPCIKVWEQKKNWKTEKKNFFISKNKISRRCNGILAVAGSYSYSVFTLENVSILEV